MTFLTANVQGCEALISCLVEVSSAVDDQSSNLKMTIETADEKGRCAIIDSLIDVSSSVD